MPEVRLTRECSAVGCRVVVPIHDAMCEQHWAMVPKHCRAVMMYAYMLHLDGDPGAVRVFRDAHDEAVAVVMLAGG